MAGIVIRNFHQVGYVLIMLGLVYPIIKPGGWAAKRRKTKSAFDKWATRHSRRIQLTLVLMGLALVLVDHFT